MLDSPRSPRASPRLAPIALLPRVSAAWGLESPRSLASSHRGGTALSACGTLKGGGGLYSAPPLHGYSEEDMVREAQLRNEYNRHRRQFKGMLSTASNGTSNVLMKDLCQAAKIAKMDLPDDLLKDRRFTAQLSPRAVQMNRIRWRPFVDAVDYPPLRGPGGFATKEMSYQEKKKIDYPVLQTATKAALQMNTEEPEARQVLKYFEMIRTKMLDRFAELRRAFRTIDKDASGAIESKEMREILLTFNLNIPEKVLNKILDLADYDGDGQIDYAEFARMMTADDLMNMKDTLEAAERGIGSGVKAAKYFRSHPPTPCYLIPSSALYPNHHLPDYSHPTSSRPPLGSRARWPRAKGGEKEYTAMQMSR